MTNRPAACDSVRGRNIVLPQQARIEKKKFINQFEAECKNAIKIQQQQLIGLDTAVAASDVIYCTAKLLRLAERCERRWEKS